MSERTPADLARFTHPVPVGAIIPGGTEWVNRDTPSTFSGPHVRRNDFQAGPATPRWTAEPLPTPTPTKDAAMNDSLPRVIRFDELREGDLIELSNPELPEWSVRGRIDGFDRDGDAHIVGHGYLLRRASHTLRLLDRPAPALPDQSGTVIDCTLDGDPGAVLMRDKDGWWPGVAGRGCSTIVVAREAASRITNWTVVYDPTAQPGVES